MFFSTTSLTVLPKLGSTYPNYQPSKGPVMAVIPGVMGSWAYPISYQVFWSQWVNASLKVWWIHGILCTNSEAKEPLLFTRFSYCVLAAVLPDPRCIRMLHVCRDRHMIHGPRSQRSPEVCPRVSAWLSQLKLQSIVLQMQIGCAKQMECET